MTIIHQGHELVKPVDVYDLLGSQISSDKQNVTEVPSDQIHLSSKYDTQSLYKCGDIASKGLSKLGISKSSIRRFLTLKDIQNLSRALKNILHK